MQNDDLIDLKTAAAQFQLKESWLRKAIADGLLFSFSDKVFTGDVERLLRDCERAKREMFSEQQQAEADAKGQSPLQRHQHREQQLRDAAMQMSRGSSAQVEQIFDGSENDLQMRMMRASNK